MSDLFVQFEYCYARVLCLSMVAAVILVSWLSVQRSQTTNTSSTQTEQLKKTHNRTQPIAHPTLAVQRRPIRVSCCENYDHDQKKRHPVLL